jgi:hypothetical protein
MKSYLRLKNVQPVHNIESAVLVFLLSQQNINKKLQIK